MEIEICQQQNRRPKVWDDTCLKPVVTHKLPFPARAEVEGKSHLWEKHPRGQWIYFVHFVLPTKQTKTNFLGLFFENEKRHYVPIGDGSSPDGPAVVLQTKQWALLRQRRVPPRPSGSVWHTNYWDGRRQVRASLRILSQTLALMLCAWKHAN